ncbi:ATP-dependent helicase HrpB [Cereibacter sphaeroides]|uniref:ATP-dependent helicase HrpB n=1 Tax=Cereibacter sphaeroides TaxID=1063 RepID=UPI001F1FFD18|nr:ATP-dependent helicase HrpB [Cereibacter sphaeroides]MCE6957999.1 ATP-dependent helicase HrpB [Cereibacter sphaeroides]MCE6972478.1 ATP-dependent helicase HrpB [Cereibacter sphaeroides]
MSETLPIDAALPELVAALRSRRMAVLQAPPGAGKTTRVPLAMLDAGLCEGRIILLEPRRLAARAAAERMAATRGEAVGQTVGYRIRGEAKVSRATRIEVVTEGILTRMIQDDPALDGIGALIFDEFHERSLNADLGLALALEVRGALREDLLLVAMSATLDAAPVAALMGDAPVVTSEGRAFPVETRWLPKPLPPGARLEPEVAAIVRQALAETEGDMLVFLPGEAEIRRVQGLLDLPGCEVAPLFGAMDFGAQRAALAPSERRKVVLATSIAETSLTIPGVRVVVDAGRARRARFDPNSGMSRLVTERVTRAEAEQRRGRAGRVAPGICFRMWTKGEEGALLPFPPAEIEAADLTGLALELAVWGSSDLAFLTPPHPGVLAEARALLEDLGALENGRITDHGRALARLPLHPRLGHMLALSGPQAAPLAALIADRDPVKGPPDLALRLAALRDPKRFSDEHPHEVNRAALARIRDEARRLARSVTAPDAGFSPGQMAALAYPDRIGLRRKGDSPRWVLSGGKGAAMEPGQPLSGARLIVATDLDGNAREAKVRQAAAITESELRELFAPQIRWREVCEWSRREGRVIARRQEMLGALVLDDRSWPDAPPEALARAAVEGLRQIGLPWSPSARRLRARIALLHAEGADLPDVSDAALLADPDWLLPFLGGRRTEADLRALDLTEPLRARLGWEGGQLLDRLAPSHFKTPLGRRVPIDYEGEAPGIEIRLQEMFGVTAHPTVGPKRLPLRITLLSPGQRPVQVTMDLPGFWASSYADVRRDMRGRYPRHPWPEDPTEAQPTTRAKPRGT